MHWLLPAVVGGQCFLLWLLFMHLFVGVWVAAFLFFVCGFAFCFHLVEWVSFFVCWHVVGCLGQHLCVVR